MLTSPHGRLFDLTSWSMFATAAIQTGATPGETGSMQFSVSASSRMPAFSR